MMENNFFNPFAKKPETPVSPDNLEERVEQELTAESAKLEANLNGLSNDIEEIGGEEELKEALEKNPSIVTSILKKTALIMPILITMNTIFSGSFSEAIRTGNTEDIATLLFQFTAGGAMFAALIEAGKLLSKKENTNE